MMERKDSKLRKVKNELKKLRVRKEVVKEMNVNNEDNKLSEIKREKGKKRKMEGNSIDSEEWSESIQEKEI